MATKTNTLTNTPTKTGRTWLVGEVATTARVSVRTLHHYEQIGLLVPQGRTEAGYRFYVDGDLSRLQEILLHRQLGMSLEAIATIIDDDDEVHRRDRLELQRAALLKRRGELDATIVAVDNAIAALTLTEDDMSKGNDIDFAAIFDGFDPEDHADEAQQRWGQSDAWKQSAARTKGYSKDDWVRLKAEADGIMAKAASLYEAGISPSDVDAMDVAEAYRAHISRWFYDCCKGQASALTDLYENDARFAANINRASRKPDLSVWWSAAIRANAAR